MKRQIGSTADRLAGLASAAVLLLWALAVSGCTLTGTLKELKGAAAAGAPIGYAEFYNAPDTDFIVTTILIEMTAEQEKHFFVPSGTVGVITLWPDGTTDRLRIPVPAGQANFTVYVDPGNESVVTVPVEQGRVTPVELKWKIVKRTPTGTGSIAVFYDLEKVILPSVPYLPAQTLHRSPPALPAKPAQN